MSEVEKKIKQVNEQMEGDPLTKIKQLEAQMLKQEQLTEAREKELLLEIAQRVEENKATRQQANKAKRDKEIAEFQYINQQRTNIEGSTNILNALDDNPERRAKAIFLERLRARRERSQKNKENKPDNIYYL